MKVVTLLAIMILIGCASPPQATGGLDPNAAAWSAAGTATAASISVNGTAVSVNATRQASSYAATMQAQATAVQATSAAAPTVTAQAQLLSVVASGQATQDAIAADVARAEATATAVSLRAQAQNDINRAIMRGKVVTGLWVLLAAAASTGLLVIWARTAVYVKDASVRRERERGRPDLIEDGDGNILALAEGFRQIATSPRIIPAPTPQATPKPQPMYLQRKRGIDLIGSFPAPGTDARTKVNNWLVSILSGQAGLDRPSANKYGIGNDLSQSVINLAVENGYATKTGAGGRTATVEPLDNFEELVDLFIEIIIPPTPA